MISLVENNFFHKLANFLKVKFLEDSIHEEKLVIVYFKLKLNVSDYLMVADIFQSSASDVQFFVDNILLFRKLIEAYIFQT